MRPLAAAALVVVAATRRALPSPRVRLFSVPSELSPCPRLPGRRARRRSRSHLRRAGACPRAGRHPHRVARFRPGALRARRAEARRPRLEHEDPDDGRGGGPARLGSSLRHDARGRRPASPPACSREISIVTGSGDPSIVAQDLRHAARVRRVGHGADGGGHPARRRPAHRRRRRVRRRGHRRRMGVGLPDRGLRRAVRRAQLQRERRRRAHHARRRRRRAGARRHGAAGQPVRDRERRRDRTGWIARDALARPGCLAARG